MSLVEILDGYNKLRGRLVPLVGPAALAEITTAIPKGTASELAFLRLVGWSYALFHENGRLAIKFLLSLGGRPQSTTLNDVQVLRTWAAHNLSFGAPSDEKKLRAAWAWFRRSCGVTTPDEQHWGDCFSALANEVAVILRDCVTAAEALDHPIDGARIVEELKRRVEREWEAHRFDRYVEDAAERFGFRGLDPVELRRSKLDAWRRVVRAANAEDMDRLLTQRIEADVLELMGGALPLTASEIVERIACMSPTAVAVWMSALKRRDPMSAEEFASALVELGHVMPADVDAGRQTSTHT